MNGLQGNCCILWIDIVWGLQKFGLIKKNIYIPLNLKLEKHDYLKVVCQSKNNSTKLCQW